MALPKTPGTLEVQRRGLSTTVHTGGRYDKEVVKKVKETDKLFEKEGIRWRGAITAIDGFSRYAYVYTDVPARRTDQNQ